MQGQVDRFREVRHKTVSILAELTDTQALWSPRKRTWSVAQIADHLLSTEEMYREQFRRLLRTGASINISLSEVSVAFAMIPHDVMPLFEVPFRMFNHFVPHVVRETMVRYPLIASLNPQASQPRETLVPANLRHELKAAFAETEEFFQSPMPANFYQLTVNHPIMGNNTVPQLFRIVIAHEQRHHEQIARVRSHAGFPKS